MADQYVTWWCCGRYKRLIMSENLSFHLLFRRIVRRSVVSGHAGSEYGET